MKSSIICQNAILKKHQWYLKTRYEDDVILSLIYRSVDFNLKVTMENFDPKYDIINEFRFVFSLHSTTFLTNLIITRLSQHSIFYK